MSTTRTRTRRPAPTTLVDATPERLHEDALAARAAVHSATLALRLAEAERDLADARREAGRCEPGDAAEPSWRAVLSKLEARVERLRGDV